MTELLGYAMILIAGGLLHNVPFPRFISAMMLMSVGTFFIMGK